MVNTVPVSLIIGTLLGLLSGLGVGGGSLLMLWLTLVLNMPQLQARLINLLCFIPCAAVASVFRHRQGALELKKVFPAIAAGCLSAGLFSWVSGHMDTALLKKIFGILLLITGVRELFYSPKKKPGGAP